MSTCWKNKFGLYKKQGIAPLRRRIPIRLFSSLPRLNQHLLRSTCSMTKICLEPKILVLGTLLSADHVSWWCWKHSLILGTLSHPPLQWGHLLLCCILWALSHFCGRLVLSAVVVAKPYMCAPQNHMGARFKAIWVRVSKPYGCVLYPTLDVVVAKNRLSTIQNYSPPSQLRMKTCASPFRPVSANTFGSVAHRSTHSPTNIRSSLCGLRLR